MYAPTLGDTSLPATEPEAYRRAKHRVARLRGFYNHLSIYIVINAFLAVLNLATDAGHLWFPWVIAGWGIGVALHAYSTFTTGVILGADWEERKIREFMERQPS